jgi:hypothetical protein
VSEPVTDAPAGSGVTGCVFVHDNEPFVHDNESFVHDNESFVHDNESFVLEDENGPCDAGKG